MKDNREELNHKTVDSINEEVNVMDGLNFKAYKTVITYLTKEAPEQTKRIIEDCFNTIDELMVAQGCLPEPRRFASIEIYSNQYIDEMWNRLDACRTDDELKARIEDEQERAEDFYGTMLAWPIKTILSFLTWCLERRETIKAAEEAGQEVPKRQPPGAFDMHLEVYPQRPFPGLRN